MAQTSKADKHHHFFQSNKAEEHYSIFYLVLPNFNRDVTDKS